MTFDGRRPLMKDDLGWIPALRSFFFDKRKEEFYHSNLLCLLVIVQGGRQSGLIFYRMWLGLEFRKMSESKA